MNVTQAPAPSTQPPSSWVSVAERGIVVSMLAAIVAAVLWQAGLGETIIVTVCAVAASIAGWAPVTPQRQLAVQRVHVRSPHRSTRH